MSPSSHLFPTTNSIIDCYQNPKLAQHQYYYVPNEHQPVWETKEWKIVRDRVKKSQCEWCSSTGILVVQQTWKFPKFRQVKNQVISELLLEQRNRGINNDFILTDDLVEIASKEFCPECDSGTLQVRKVKQPKYKCKNGDEFDDPIIRIDETNPVIRQARYEWQKAFENNNQQIIDQRIQQIYQQLESRYLSGKETITLCRSCAYHRKKGNIKCQICDKNFHARRYESCYECNTIECTECGENRIMKSRDPPICDDCMFKPSDELCGICNTNQAEQGMKICGDCVLQGHWID